MDEQLDQAIDEVAREMTAAEPSPTMRTDVLSRIEREGGRRAPGQHLPRWAWAGAAAVLVLSVATTAWIVLSVPAPGSRQIAARNITGSAGPTTPSTPATTSAGPAADATMASAQPVARPRAVRPAAAAQRFGLPDEAGPAPLAGPDAIEIVPLEPAALAVPSLGVTALGQIEPITVSTIGPGSPEPQRRDRE
jgi:hypothetical protein